MFLEHLDLWPLGKQRSPQPGTPARLGAAPPATLVKGEVRKGLGISAADGPDPQRRHGPATVRLSGGLTVIGGVSCEAVFLAARPSPGGSTKTCEVGAGRVPVAPGRDLRDVGL